MLRCGARTQTTVVRLVHARLYRCWFTLHSPATQHARLFRNNRSKIARIPVEFELSGENVLIHREGNRLIFELVPRKTLLDILLSLEPLTKDDWVQDDIDTELFPAKAVNL